MQKHDEGTGNRDVPDVNVMHARIQMLFEAFREVKSLLKGIEETVGIIKVFDLQIKQQSSDFSRLEDAVRDYRRHLEQEVTNLEGKISAAKAAMQEDLDAVTTDGLSTKNELDKRVSFMQGVVAAVSILGAVLYGGGVWMANRYIDTVDEQDRYIHTLKTLDAEQHLRDAMAEPPPKYELDVKPTVTSPPSTRRRAGSKEPTPRM